MVKVTLRPNYRSIDGMLFPAFQPEHIRKALNYKAKPDDVFIATYPKCGTTWMQQVALYIFRKGQELEDHNDFKLYCPFIECKGLKSVEAMPRPGAIKTHLPFNRIPYCPEAKYINVLRNPKDCCVSLYYHTIGGHKNVYSEATFDDFFELFMAGEVEYNDYFDHLMSWYPHRNDKNVFFTTYEDMKRDLKDVVLKLATFLGREYIEAIERDNNVLNNIVRFSGFNFMKTNLSQVFQPRRNRPEDSEKAEEEFQDEDSKAAEDSKTEEDSKAKRSPHHLRKGIVGDWKNHFSEEQNERMNKKFTERLQGTEIYEMYKPYILG